VTAGLYISWNGLRLISAETRLQGIFFWDFLEYLINGMVFVITGLQARSLFGGMRGVSPAELLISAAVVSAVVIVTRFVWMFPATYLPRWLIPSLARRDPAPPWQWPFVIGFTGVRGIVSLAAALGIPFATADGLPFPHRNLLLFLTFAVILVTLVGQGLPLPWLIRRLGLADAGRRERHADRVEEFDARRQAVAAASAALDELMHERELPEDIVRPLRALHRDRLKRAQQRVDGDAAHRKFIALADEVELRLIAVERDTINELFRRGGLKDEARRAIERDLDLREAHVANLQERE